MANFVYFGSIFATRFQAGKDLRITDSNETQMKAPWLAVGDKFISARPYFLSLTPKFLEGEKLNIGKPVSMDGARYICRLPIIHGVDGCMESSPDYEMIRAWGNALKSKNFFHFYARHSPNDPTIDVVSVVGSNDPGPCQAAFMMQPSQVPEWMRSRAGFVPVLEPIPDYSPATLVGQQVTVIVTGDTLRGELLDYSEYDLLLRPEQAYQEDHPSLGQWGRWQANGVVIIDRSAVMQLIPNIPAAL